MLAKVMEIMSDVLGVEVRPGSNFLDLGDSVDAVELCARLRDRTGVRVPLELLWQVPDVAAFAAEVERLAPVAR
jgi:acyl carrier protein